MPDVDELKEGKKYYTDIPQKTEGFFLKGSNSLDWGMKNRLSRIFNPKTRAHRHAGHRSWLFSGADHRP